MQMILLLNGIFSRYISFTPTSASLTTLFVSDILKKGHFFFKKKANKNFLHSLKKVCIDGG